MKCHRWGSMMIYKNSMDPMSTLQDGDVSCVER